MYYFSDFFILKLSEQTTMRISLKSTLARLAAAILFACSLILLSEKLIVHLLSNG